MLFSILDKSELSSKPISCFNPENLKSSFFNCSSLCFFSCSCFSNSAFCLSSSCLFCSASASNHFCSASCSAFFSASNLDFACLSNSACFFLSSSCLNSSSARLSLSIWFNISFFNSIKGLNTFLAFEQMSTYSVKLAP